MGRKPLYPHVPKSKRNPTVHQQFLDDLEKAVNEEADASIMYLGMARVATALGLKTWATTLEQIANDENRHHIRLEEMLGEAKKYPYHAVAYGYEGQILETDDFQYLPNLDILAKWAVDISKRIYGKEEGGYGPGLKMAVDKIVVTGPNLQQKWTSWDLFR